MAHPFLVWMAAVTRDKRTELDYAILPKRFKQEGLLAHVHCHGKVRHALQCMLDMGVASTDPVEPPPAGDVTMAEARQIVGDRLTLLGNFEFDELEFASTDHVRRRVEEMLAQGPRRLVLGASAGPSSKITPKLAENYKAWIDTAVKG